MKITNKIEILESIEDGKRSYQIIVNGTLAHEESGRFEVYNKYPTFLYKFIDYVMLLVGWKKGNIKEEHSCEQCINRVESICQKVEESLVESFRRAFSFSPKSDSSQLKDASDKSQVVPD